jgi:hypothetical protein
LIRFETFFSFFTCAFRPLQIANNLKDAERVEKKEAAAEEAAANVRPTDAARSHGNVSFGTGTSVFRPWLGADSSMMGFDWRVFFFSFQTFTGVS